MTKARTKGKIPHGEWPRILSLYASGETIAQIGRDYGCTAPSIRYIIKRGGKLKGESAKHPGSSSAADITQAPTRRVATLPEPGHAARPMRARPTAPSPPIADAVRSASVLAPELRRQVTGDVISFLAALDQAMSDGS